MKVPRWSSWGPNKTDKLTCEHECCEQTATDQFTFFKEGYSLVYCRQHASEYLRVTETDIRFELAQITCSPGGWANSFDLPTEEERKSAEKRWALRAYLDEVKDEHGHIEHQCGGCRYFAATGSDYGICWNEKSPMDGMVCQEHGGCLQHSVLTATTICKRCNGTGKVEAPNGDIAREWFCDDCDGYGRVKGVANYDEDD